jgi:VIT1/CCC1 family predicted Fe2+/Mn2+ transporter
MSSPLSAVQDGDIEASMRVHDIKAAHGAEEVWHGGLGSERIKSIVFGGLDGIITTFAIVAAVVGGGLPVEVVLMMGTANLLADGISMGLGDFLSSKAEHDFILSERRREAWEYEHNPEGERLEMVNIYKEKGFADEDAEAIIQLFTKKPEYTKAFVDHMMVEELGQQVPDEDENPMWDGIATFISFVCFGAIPVVIYAICYGAGYRDTGGQFGICCAATALTMFLLGFVQAVITKQNPWTSGFLMMINGALAAAAAYLVGWGLEEALGVQAAVFQSLSGKFASTVF